MDHDELEDTMRHGLQELANDAPRAEGLWETTANMIAIQADQAPPESSVAAANDDADERGLSPLAKIAIALGITIAVVVAITLITLLILQS